MSIKFNNFNNDYDRYKLNINKNLPNESKEAQKSEDVQEKANFQAFKGLENETDLLTQSNAGLFGVKLGKFTPEDKELADKTNEILASLGYDYKVTATQVASVTMGVKEIVMPGMKLAEDGAVAAHIQDPNGPFADLFT